MFDKAFTRIAAFALLFAVAAHGVEAQAPAGALGVGETGALVVLSGGGAEALLIDPVTRGILGRFPTGPDPREVAVSPDGRYAYVTSYGWQPTREVRTGDRGEGIAYWDAASGAIASGGRGVTVLDLNARSVHAVFQPGTYRNLQGIRVGKDGRRIWMTAERDSAIVEVDATTGDVLMLWKTGGANPNSLIVTRDNRRLFVANSGSDHLTMIDRVTVVPSTIATGRNPVALALSRGEKELWVANNGDHTISVVDTRRLREVASFPSGGTGPTRLAFNPAGNEVWVSHSGTREVVVLDVVSAAVLARIPFDAEPRSIAFSASGAAAFVSAPQGHQVYVIDTGTREIVDTLDAGSLPSGVAWGGQHVPARGSGR